MKNNRLTNDDIRHLRNAVARIKNLANLENASFVPFNEEEDKVIKEKIRPYMMWFECVASGIEDILNGKEDIPDYLFR